MQFFEVLEKRHSGRHYGKPILPEIVMKVEAAAKTGPSAGGKRARRIIQVYSDEMKRQLARASKQDFVAEATAVLVFVALPEKSAARYGERGRTLYAVQDATIAATLAHLAATAMGLESCWVGAFSERRVSRILRLNADERPICLLPIGAKP